MSALEKQLSDTVGSIAVAQAGSGLGNTSQLPIAADEKNANPSLTNSSDGAEPKLAERSPAAELGKGKAAIVMSALCVSLSIRTERGYKLIRSSR